jgi:hypothetical protein
VQAFAVALALYPDTAGLGGASLVSNELAKKFGFKVTIGGAGVFNFGSNGAAFGVPFAASTPANAGVFSSTTIGADDDVDGFGWTRKRLPATATAASQVPQLAAHA